MILTVHVKPGAKKNSVAWIDDDTLKISVSAIAEKGKANQAVINCLADELNIAKSNIKLIRGAKTRIKQFEIT